MLCLSGFELSSRWVPLKLLSVDKAPERPVDSDQRKWKILKSQVQSY